MSVVYRLGDTGIDLHGFPPGALFEIELQGSLSQTLMSKQVELPKEAGSIEAIFDLLEASYGSTLILLRDEAGKPIPDATLITYSQDDATGASLRKRIRQKLDDRGEFLLEFAALGRIRIQAKAPGFLPLSHSFEQGRGQTIQEVRMVRER